MEQLVQDLKKIKTKFSDIKRHDSIASSHHSDRPRLQIRYYLQC